MPKYRDKITGEVKNFDYWPSEGELHQTFKTGLTGDAPEAPHPSAIPSPSNPQESSSFLDTLSRWGGVGKRFLQDSPALAPTLGGVGGFMLGGPPGAALGAAAGSAATHLSRSLPAYLGEGDEYTKSHKVEHPVQVAGDEAMSALSGYGLGQGVAALPKPNLGVLKYVPGFKKLGSLLGIADALGGGAAVAGGGAATQTIPSTSGNFPNGPFIPKNSPNFKSPSPPAPTPSTRPRVSTPSPTNWEGDSGALGKYGTRLQRPSEIHANPEDFFEGVRRVNAPEMGTGGPGMVKPVESKSNVIQTHPHKAPLSDRPSGAGNPGRIKTARAENYTPERTERTILKNEFPSTGKELPYEFSDAMRGLEEAGPSKSKEFPAGWKKGGTKSWNEAGAEEAERASNPKEVERTQEKIRKDLDYEKRAYVPDEFTTSMGFKGKSK